jgi:hypothetical protein
VQEKQGDAMRTCVGEEDQRKTKRSGGSPASPSAGAAPTMVLSPVAETGEVRGVWGSYRCRVREGLKEEGRGAGAGTCGAPAACSRAAVFTVDRRFEVKFECQMESNQYRTLIKQLNAFPDRKNGK